MNGSGVSESIRMNLGSAGSPCTEAGGGPAR